MIETREADMLRREKAVEEARQGYQETAHREVSPFYMLFSGYIPFFSFHMNVHHSLWHQFSLHFFTQALARVQSELEILSRERSSLMLEKQHFADEVGAQKALVSSALALKAQLKAQSEELICKEEELLVGFIVKFLLSLFP